MCYETIEVVSNERGRFTVAENEQSNYRVMGTGMLKPRYFHRCVEAVEFAQDQLLILTLECEVDANA